MRNMTVTTFMAVGLLGAASLAQQQSGLSAQSSQPRVTSFSHAWAGDRLSRQDTPVVTFDEADQNNDGKLTRREARGVPNLSFSSADSDNDSWLSREEFTLATANPRG